MMQSEQSQLEILPAMAPPDRIRVVCLIPAMTRGGTERQLLELLRSIDRTRFDPTLILFGNSPAGASYKLGDAVGQVFSLNISPGGNFRARNTPGLALGTMRLVTILRRIRPHVVHAFLPAPAVIGGMACWLTGVPVFLVGRRSMASYHRRGSRILTWFDRLPLRYATGLVGNCNAIAKEAITADGLPAERAFTIHNGVDRTSFHWGRDEELRADLGFAVDDIIFGVIANFHSIKRHLDFVFAAELIRKRAPQARFLMVGSDYGELPELLREIRGRGLDSCFEIVAGTAEPERYYRAMDVYVCASEVEGMSNSILEAMASGIPVIATNVGGNPELVVNGQTGFLVPPFAPDMIAANALTLISERILRSGMGRRALQIVQERYTADAMVKAHEDLYSDLVGKALVG